MKPFLFSPKFIFGIAFSLVGCLLQAQVFSNDISDANPSSANPFTAGQVVDPNITVSGIGRGSGINGDNAANRYSANSWNTPSIDLTAYFEFTLTPVDGYAINFSSFTYTGQASGTGPTNFAFRSSLNNFTTDIGSPGASGGNIDLSDDIFQDIESSITFRLYGWGGSMTVGTFSVNGFSFNGEAPLPIELAHFGYQVQANHVILNWSTSTEKNNDYMAIERSVDAENFSEIGRVKGAGSSLERIDYSFIDRFPYKGTNYYRLRQVDYDGTTTYHKVIAVEFTGESINTLGFVPTAEGIQVQFRAPGAGGELILVDATGRILRIQKFDGQSTSSQLSTAALPRGFYVLQVRRADGKREVWPLVK